MMKLVLLGMSIAATPAGSIWQPTYNVPANQSITISDFHRDGERANGCLFTTFQIVVILQ
jgi:hypothetical protein